MNYITVTYRGKIQSLANWIIITFNSNFNKRYCICI